ncbi:cupin domain-containing protein [Roseomonas haemaphysalidis]|nr:cupin domain-containing protein [Roseomonas haemaphysalidis]
MTRFCQHWDEVPEAGAKRLLAGASADLVMVRIPAGTQGQRHSHPHEQFVQVISGAGTLWTDQGEQSFGPGSVFHFPAGVEHRAEFSAETVLVETNLRA